MGDSVFLPDVGVLAVLVELLAVVCWGIVMDRAGRTTALGALAAGVDEVGLREKPTDDRPSDDEGCCCCSVGETEEAENGG